MEREARYQIPTEDVLNPQIIDLRNRLRLGTKEIAIRVNKPVSTVSYRLSVLMSEGEVDRLRRRRRTREELQEYDSQVKALIEAGFSNRQAADELRETVADIRNSVLRSLKRGEIERRWSRVPEEQRAAIIELRKSNHSYSDIAQELNMSKSKVARIVGQAKREGILG